MYNDLYLKWNLILIVTFKGYTKKINALSISLFELLEANCLHQIFWKLNADGLSLNPLELRHPSQILMIKRIHRRKTAFFYG